MSFQDRLLGCSARPRSFSKVGSKCAQHSASETFSLRTSFIETHNDGGRNNTRRATTKEENEEMKKCMTEMLLAVATAVATFSQPVLADTNTFKVDPEAGNNTFSAVFDAALGERIMAVSSAVGCTITADEGQLEGRAKCSVPLISIKVDSDDTKTDHFQQWATNKKVTPKKCSFDLDLPHVQLPSPLAEKQPVTF